MKRAIYLMLASALLIGGGTATAAAGQKPPKVRGGSGSNHLWVSATKSVEHFSTSSPTSGRQSSAGSGSQSKVFVLPTHLYLFGANANARCGSGRTPVACPQTAAAAAPQPQVTQGVVLTALRRIGLPSLQAHTQPEGKTLVNFATIFYTRPRAFTRTVTLLGQRVQIHATPSTFRWHYGDGLVGTTSTPGAPYPAKDVTHNYADAHTTVQTSVDVTYTARFRVGNGPWQTIPGAVTIVGPPSPLRISEATAVLSGNY